MTAIGDEGEFRSLFMSLETSPETELKAISIMMHSVAILCTHQTIHSHERDHKKSDRMSLCIRPTFRELFLIVIL